MGPPPKGQRNGMENFYEIKVWNEMEQQWAGGQQTHKASFKLTFFFLSSKTK